MIDVAIEIFIIQKSIVITLKYIYDLPLDNLLKQCNERLRIVKWVILTKEWQPYTIDLRGKDLSYVSGGFSWTTNTEVNPGNCVFYLDNIQYE